jgi:hypothetical protein
VTFHHTAGLNGEDADEEEGIAALDHEGTAFEGKLRLYCMILTCTTRPSCCTKEGGKG